MMKITKTILSIYPYISTTWDNISTLQVVGGRAGLVLVIELLHGRKISIPGLSRDLIETIFTLHGQALEERAGLSHSMTTTLSLLPLNHPFPQPHPEIEKMGMMLQHNPEEANAPALPKELIDKVSEMIKALGLSESSLVPEPEESCNCCFCQIARAIRNAVDTEVHPNTQEKDLNEEEISEKDLAFCDWNIKQTDEQLYAVTSKLDSSENYQVYLGQPIGCTCGNPRCEHIRTVLKT